jgi:hypothetical protein
MQKQDKFFDDAAEDTWRRNREAQQGAEAGVRRHPKPGDIIQVFGESVRMSMTEEDGQPEQYADYRSDPGEGIVFLDSGPGSRVTDIGPIRATLEHVGQGETRFRYFDRSTGGMATRSHLGERYVGQMTNSGQRFNVFATVFRGIMVIEVVSGPVGFR